MAGLQIVAKDKKGKIKQDYEISRTADKRIVKVDELKKEQDKDE